MQDWTRAKECTQVIKVTKGDVVEVGAILASQFYFFLFSDTICWGRESESGQETAYVDISHGSFAWSWHVPSQYGWVKLNNFSSLLYNIIYYDI